MPFQVIPRERAFFDLLEQAADGVAAGAEELARLVRDFSDAPARGERIEQLEHDGDDLTHRIIALLNTTFVVPIDRHDILHLASSLDDVLDAVEGVADLLILHHVEEPIPHLAQQADVLLQATQAVSRAMRALRSPSTADHVWADITRLEREGDRVYRRSVADLYSGDYRAMDVLKWKDILAQMEAAIDRCEDIANTIESVVLKHA